MRYLGVLAVVAFVAVLAGWAGLATTQAGGASESTGGGDGLFAREVIDLGVVCSDVEKSVAFYTKVVGFTESKAENFAVNAQFGGDSGLSDYAPLNVRVLKLMAKDSATRLKLMQFPNKPGKKTDQRFIHSSIGYSYITVFVKDLNASNARAKRAGAKLVAKSPVQIGDGPMGLTLLKDPDGNIVELVGRLK